MIIARQIHTKYGVHQIMSYYTQNQIKTITFKGNTTHSGDESVRALKEWIIVETISNVVVPNGVDLAPIDYFCQQQGIDIKEIGEYPVELGLTVNGHEVKFGNQMIHAIFDMYQGMYEKSKIVDNLDVEKEYTIVRELAEMATRLCDMAESVNDAVSDPANKDHYIYELSNNRDKIKSLIG